MLQEKVQVRLNLYMMDINYIMWTLYEAFYTLMMLINLFDLHG